ncbi:helix-turn-helix domain-containing protein [Streptomyces sp. DSS69]|uniref:helix-turn-helix domain-containing protein n=1 Tax=Streptomyces sp. DSS69 TaxID=3113369 RepID=UPI0031F9E546
MTILPPRPDRDALRVTLARLRNAREWTFDELAGRSGLARAHAESTSNMGRAAGTCHTTWHALAHAFDVPIEQLLGSLCDDHTRPGTKGA